MVVAVAFLVLAFRAATSESAGVDWPSWPYVVGASLAYLLTQLTAGRSWTVMFQGHGSTVDHFTAFLRGQVGKYVPGGVVQAFSQVEGSKRAGATTELAGTLFPVHVLLTVIASGGVMLALAAVSGTHLAPAARLLLAFAGVAATALVHRSWMARLLETLHDRHPSIPSGDIVPRQSTLWWAYSLGTIPYLALGTAFALLLGVTYLEATQALAAYGVAILAGFLAVPFPSGIGIRELVLLALAPPGIPASDILAAAILLRLIQVSADALGAGLSSGISQLLSGDRTPRFVHRHLRRSRQL